MASRAFVTTGEFIAAVPDHTAYNDERLAFCLDAACAAIERRCHVRFLTASYAVWHSGDRAVLDEAAGCNAAKLYLADDDSRYATPWITAVPSITEDGTALTVQRIQQATSWTDGESAIVNDRFGTVLRATVSAGKISPKNWASGRGNIRCSYTAGVKIDGTEPAAPEDLKDVAIRLAMLMIGDPLNGNVEQLSQAGYSATFLRLLPPTHQSILRSYDRRWSPLTIEY